MVDTTPIPESAGNQTHTSVIFEVNLNDGVTDAAEVEKKRHELDAKQEQKGINIFIVRIYI